MLQSLIDWLTAVILPWVTFFSMLVMTVATVVLAIYAVVTVEEGKKDRRKDTIQEMLRDVFSPLSAILLKAKERGRRRHLSTWAFDENEMTEIERIGTSFGHYLDKNQLIRVHEMLRRKREQPPPADMTWTFQEHEVARISDYVDNTKNELGNELTKLTEVVFWRRPMSRSRERECSTATELRNGVGGSPATKAEVIHHCDSVLAILLVAVVFLSNVWIGLVQRSESSGFAEPTLALAVDVSIVTLVVIVSVLRRSWFLKITGWFIAFWLLLYLLGFTFLGLMHSVVPDVTYFLIYLVCSVCVGVVPVVLAWFVVLDEYCARLALVSCHDDELTALRLRRGRYYFLFLLTAISGTTLLFWP